MLEKSHISEQSSVCWKIIDFRGPIFSIIFTKQCFLHTILTPRSLTRIQPAFKVTQVSEVGRSLCCTYFWMSSWIQTRGEKHCPTFANAWYLFAQMIMGNRLAQAWHHGCGSEIAMREDSSRSVLEKRELKKKEWWYITNCTVVFSGQAVRRTTRGSRICSVKRWQRSKV